MNKEHKAYKEIDDTIKKRIKEIRKKVTEIDKQLQEIAKENRANLIKGKELIGSNKLEEEKKAYINQLETIRKEKGSILREAAERSLIEYDEKVKPALHKLRAEHEEEREELEKEYNKRRKELIRKQNGIEREFRSKYIESRHYLTKYYYSKGLKAKYIAAKREIERVYY